MSTTTASDKHALARVGSFASRKDRFIATLIDSVILAAATIPVMFILGRVGLTSNIYYTQLFGVATAVAAFMIFNFKLLKETGQTVGKKVMNICIVGRDDQPLVVEELLIKRYAWTWGLMLIPVVGGLLCLLNVLCIFRESQACFHDDVAMTKVVPA